MARDTMTAQELVAAMAELEVTQVDLAARLRVLRPRVSDWCTGRRPVPPYIAAHVETLLELEAALAELGTLKEEGDL